MRVNFSLAIVCAAAVSLVLPIFSQHLGTAVAPKPKSAPIPKLPYTAEYKITHVQTLANGATITEESTKTIARDSQGRRMTSTTTISMSGNQTPITRVGIFDPVARTSSSWTVPGQKVTVMIMTATDAQRNCAITLPVPAGPPHISQTLPDRPKPVVEDLGIETIQGVEARGRRTITTTPAGAIGNDAPLVSTIETWTPIASGLRGLIVRSVSDSLQFGKSTWELTSFIQAEPDVSLFQLPEGYEIVNKSVLGSLCHSVEGTDTPEASIPPPPPEQ